MDPQTDLNHFLITAATGKQVNNGLDVLSVGDRDTQERIIRKCYMKNASLRHPWILTTGIDNIVAVKSTFGNMMGDTRVARVHNAAFDPVTRKIYAHYTIYFQPKFPLITKYSTHTLSAIVQKFADISSSVHPPMTLMERVPASDIQVSNSVLLEMLVLYDVEPEAQTVTDLKETSKNLYKIVAENVFWIQSPLVPTIALVFLDLLDISYFGPISYLTKLLNLQDYLKYYSEKFNVQKILDMLGISGTKTSEGENYPWTIVMQNQLKSFNTTGIIYADLLKEKYISKKD